MNQSEKKMVLDAFAASPRERGNHFFGVIRPRAGGEFTVTVYAVKETKRRGVEIVEVNRGWTDRPVYVAKNLWGNVYGQRMVEYDERRNRPELSFDWYRGKWGQPEKWTMRNTWHVDGVEYVNPDALEGTRYKFAGFDKYTGPLPLVRYCQLFAEFPEVELLAKAGLSRFVVPAFLRQCRRDPKLRSFFRQNTKEIKRWHHSTADVIRAAKHGWTLAKARAEARFDRRMQGTPAGVDKHELDRYLRKNHLDLADWMGYAREVEEAGEDIRVFGVTMPRDLHAARRKMQAKIRRIRAKQAAEAAKREAERRARLEAELMETAKRINKALARMTARLEIRLHGLSVIFPTTRAEFVAEGQAMRNCIGGYFERHATGEARCFFIRRGGRRVADVEVSRSGKILQCRAKCNKEIGGEVREFAELVARRIARVA